MRGAVAWEAGAPFRVHDDLQRRDPGPGEVVVRIRAAGLCQTDISLARGAFGQSMPVVLGHEGAGEVVELGPGVTGLATGDRVVLTWVPPCGHCYFCVRGETYLCANRKRAGDRGAGDDLSVGETPIQAGMGTATFAQETVVGANSVIPLPDDLPFELAALLGCAVPTGLGAALNTARVHPGATVLVIGCGAVGLSAIQGAVIAGAALVAARDPQPARLEIARALGARDDEPRGIGFDVVIDAVGNSATIRTAWDAARRGGTVVVVGAGKPDDQGVFSAAELFHDQKRLLGCFYGSAHNRPEGPGLGGLWRGGRARPGTRGDEGGGP